MPDFDWNKLTTKANQILRQRPARRRPAGPTFREFQERQGLKPSPEVEIAGPPRRLVETVTAVPRVRGRFPGLTPEREAEVGRVRARLGQIVAPARGALQTFGFPRTPQEELTRQAVLKQRPRLAALTAQAPSVPGAALRAVEMAFRPATFPQQALFQTIANKRGAWETFIKHFAPETWGPLDRPAQGYANALQKIGFSAEVAHIIGESFELTGDLPFFFPEATSSLIDKAIRSGQRLSAPVLQKTAQLVRAQGPKVVKRLREINETLARPLAGGPEAGLARVRRGEKLRQTVDAYMVRLIKEGKTIAEAQRIASKLYPKIQVEQFMKVPARVPLTQTELRLRAPGKPLKIGPVQREINVLQTGLARKLGITEAEVSTKFGTGKTPLEYVEVLRRETRPSELARRTAELFPGGITPPVRRPKVRLAPLKKEVKFRPEGPPPPPRPPQPPRPPIKRPPPAAPPPETLAQLRALTERPIGPPGVRRPVPEPERVRRVLVGREPIPGPKEELQRISREINRRSQALAQELFQEDAAVELIGRIRSEGGIRPGRELEEFRRNVPQFLRSPKGLAPDEMASALGFESDTALFDRLSKITRMPQPTDFIKEARTRVELINPELFRGKETMETLVRGGLGEPARLPTAVQAKLLGQLLRRKVAPREAGELLKQFKVEKLATQAQKVEAFRLKKQLKLSDPKFRELMVTATGRKSLALTKRPPMIEREAEAFINLLRQIPPLVTPAQKRIILNQARRQKLTARQIKTVQTLFQTRTPKQPMTSEQAGDLIEAMSKIPPARRGMMPAVPKRIADMAKQFAEVKGVPELPSDILQVGRFVQTPVTTFDFLGKDLGDPAWKHFKLPARQGLRKYVEEVDDFAKEWHIQSKLISEAEGNRITTFALSKDPEALPLLQKMGVAPVTELTPKETQYFNWMGKKYDEVLGPINKVRAENWLEPIPRRADYIPHIRELSALSELGELNTFADINSLIFKKFHLNAPSFKYGKPREYLLRNIKLDAREIMQDYMPKALYLKHMTEPTARGRTLLKALNDKPRTQAFLTRFMDAVSGQPVGSTGMPVADMILQSARRNIGASLLSGKVRSAIIQVSALRNTMAVSNLENFPQAIGSYLSGGRRFAMEVSDVLKARIPETVMMEYSSKLEKLAAEFAAEKTGIPIIKQLPKLKSKAIQLGFTPLQVLDNETAQVSWLWAYIDEAKRLRRQGKVQWASLDELFDPRRVIQQAKVYADDLVEAGQASAQKISRARIQQTELGQTAALLNTFIIADYSFATRRIAGIGTRKFSPDTVMAIVKAITATALFNIFFEDILGLPSPFPAPVRTLQEARKRGWGTGRGLWETMLEMGGELPLLGGLRYGTSLGGAVWDTGKKAFEYVRQLFTDEHPERRISEIELGGRILGVPGSGQAAKVERAITMVDRKFPFTQEERVRTGLAGMSTTELARLRQARWDLIRDMGNIRRNAAQLTQQGKDITAESEKMRKTQGNLTRIEAELSEALKARGAITPARPLPPLRPQRQGFDWQKLQRKVEEIKSR